MTYRCALALLPLFCGTMMWAQDKKEEVDTPRRVLEEIQKLSGERALTAEEGVAFGKRALKMAEANIPGKLGFDSLYLVFQIAVFSDTTLEQARDMRNNAMAMIAQHYPVSSRLTDLMFELMSQPKRPGEEKDLVGYMTTIHDITKMKDVKAASLWARADLLLTVDNYVAPITAEQKALVVTALEALQKDYADLKHPKDRAGRTFGAMAEAPLFEIRNLSVGATAPEIEGNDLDGVAFKLSDYRGKVVVLDFWGHW